MEDWMVYIGGAKDEAGLIDADRDGDVAVWARRTKCSWCCFDSPSFLAFVGVRQCGGFRCIFRHWSAFFWRVDFWKRRWRRGEIYKWLECNWVLEVWFNCRCFTWKWWCHFYKIEHIHNLDQKISTSSRLWRVPGLNSAAILLLYPFIRIRYRGIGGCH